MIAAERTLQIRGVHGDTSVPVQIQVPIPDRDAWICRFSIGWPEGQATGYAAAMDGVQALHFAMRRIAILLYTSAHHHSRTLYFETPGDGYGFPLPIGDRDLAIGLDKNM